MKRALCTALAGVGGLAWVAFCEGTGAVGNENRPAAEQNATQPEEGEREPLAFGEWRGGSFSGAVLTVGGAALPLLVADGVPVTGERLKTDRLQFATAGFPTDTIEARTSFLEPSGLEGRVAFLERTGKNTGEAVLDPIIPEPAPLLLLGGGFLVLAAFGRKWKVKKE